MQESQIKSDANRRALQHPYKKGFANLRGPINLSYRGLASPGRRISIFLQTVGPVWDVGHYGAKLNLSESRKRANDTNAY